MGRKLIATILMIILIMQTMLMNANAGALFYVEVDIPTLKADGSITVPVSVKNVPFGINATQFDIYYQTSDLRVNAVKNGTLSQGFTLIEKPKSGFSRVILYTLTNTKMPTGSGSLALLEFTPSRTLETGRKLEFSLRNLVFSGATSPLDAKNFEVKNLAYYYQGGVQSSTPPTVIPSVAPSLTPTPTQPGTATPTQSATPLRTLAPTPTPTPMRTPTQTATPVYNIQLTPTPRNNESNTPEPTVQPYITATPIIKTTPTPVPTPTKYDYDTDRIRVSSQVELGKNLADSGGLRFFSDPELERELRETAVNSDNTDKLEEAKALNNEPEMQNGLSEIAVSVWSSAEKFHTEQGVPITVKYENQSGEIVENIKIGLEIPDGLEIDRIGEGKVSGKTIYWVIDELYGGESGELSLDLKVKKEFDGPKIEEFICKVANTEIMEGKNLSKLKVMLYSENGKSFKHSKYINGYSDGTFKPDKKVTRAEMASILSRLVNYKTDVSKKSGFIDVPSGFWAGDAIYKIVSAGLFAGYSDKTFRPDLPMSRAEFAVVIARLLKTAGMDTVNGYFLDMENHWAKPYAENIRRIGVMKGYSDKTFRPDEPISRAEMVTAINKFYFRGPLNSTKQHYLDVPLKHWAFGNIEEAAYGHLYKLAGDGSENKN